VTAEVPARAVPGTAGPDTERRRDGSRSSLVWDVLADVIAARVAQTGRTALDIVDVGAGTGGFAVSIAARGHRVTLVDPSPDALAAARWRAGEARSGPEASAVEWVEPAKLGDYEITEGLVEIVEAAERLVG